MSANVKAYNRRKSGDYFMALMHRNTCEKLRLVPIKIKLRSPRWEIISNTSVVSTNMTMKSIA